MINIIKNFSKILSKHQKFRIAELFVLMVIGGFLETCSVALILPFMDAVMEPDEIMGTWYGRAICKILRIQSAQSLLVVLAIILALLYILKNVYLMFEYNIQYKFVYGNMFALQKRMLDVFIHRPYEYFLKVNSGEVIRIITNDTTVVFNLLITTLMLVTEMVVSIMLVGTIFVITPAITSCIAVLLLLLLAVIYLFIKPLLRKAALNQQRAGTGMNKWLLQSIQGIKELKVMQKEVFFQKNYDSFGQINIRSARWNQTLQSAPRFIIEGICMGAMFIIVAILIYSGTDLESIIPMLTAVAMAAIRLLPSVNRISGALTSIAYGEPMLDKIIENLADMDAAEREETVGQNGKNDKSHLILKLKQKIDLSSITYHYPDAEEDVLHDASMTINRGESVGIVGASGAGKTTSVDIILGLLKPEKGSVMIDGIDIREDISGWLNQIGYIPQMIFMLDDSIKANVAFGEENINEEDVWRALRDASLDEFVKTLPDGIETEIGERGVRLSGGQRQRIGIARALYRNPQVLIFDEATSALDNDTESAIMESINGLRGTKTMIIIAHRLTTIETCDKVFRVEDGKIKRER